MIDLDELITEAREFADRNNGLNWQGMVRDLADALEAATRERDVLDEAFDRDLPWRYDELTERTKRAEAAIERVRELHRKETRRSGWEVCTHCEIGMLQDPVDWPCDTIAALDGAPEPEWEYRVMLKNGAELARGTLDEVRRFKTIDIERRQPAGPWLPVEGEKP